MINTNSYQARQFNLSGLNGISDRTLEMHFKLYDGYVKETNNLTDKIFEFLKDGKVDHEETPAYSELTRRLGFEYNGMVLHEYYFGNMKQGGPGNPERNSAFYRATEESFGSYDIWKADFVGIGKMRGVGWAICYANPAN
jgi:superoxide dismutase, Fe-Mn family